MATIIARTHPDEDSPYSQHQLVDAPDEVDNEYRLDLGDKMLFFDESVINPTGQYFELFLDDSKTAHLPFEELPDMIIGALSVMSDEE